MDSAPDETVGHMTDRAHSPKIMNLTSVRQSNW